MHSLTSHHQAAIHADARRPQCHCRPKATVRSQVALPLFKAKALANSLKGLAEKQIKATKITVSPGN